MIRLAVYLPFVLMLSFVLAACATTSAQGPAGTAAIPVTCVPDKLGEPLPYPDTAAALRGAASHTERLKLLMIGRKMRNYRLAEVEPVISGCRQKDQPTLQLQDTPPATPQPSLLDRIKSRLPG